MIRGFFHSKATPSQKRTGRHLLGLTFSGKPIYAPKPAHSLLYAAAGGGKTSCGAVPWLQSFLGDTKRALVINDCKDGEIAAQCADMCVKYNRKVAIIDDFGVLGPDNPHVVSLNPFNAICRAHEAKSGDKLFSIENATHALIEEPEQDEKNKYWRLEPRSMLEFGIESALQISPALATPGNLWALLSNPEDLLRHAEIQAAQTGSTLNALGKHIADMFENNPEHYSQHRGAALQALKIFGQDSPLQKAGLTSETSHLKLLQDNMIVFIVGPQRHMDRLGPYYALHLQSFMEAQLTGQAGNTSYILDEFTSAPLRAIVSKLTTMRGYGGACHMICQSRSEVQRRYGDKETATIEENALVKQWYGFSSFEEAERVSRAMGETQNVSHTLGVDSKRDAFSGTFQVGKEAMFTAEELMRLPSNEQIIHIKDVGFIHALKIRQNEIDPYAFDLADNPLEGGRLTPDPKITLYPWRATQ